jgi:hypothetical protein
MKESQGGEPPPDIRLNDLEMALIESVERGNDFTPSRADLQPDESIRATVIRAILLGLPLPGHPKRNRREPAYPVTLTSHGLRIKPADNAPGLPLLSITGTLDLEGAAAVGGDFLPPLELAHCCLDAPLNLAEAHLQSLTLTNCRLIEVKGSGARIGGAVKIDGCRPFNPPLDPGENYFARRQLAAFADHSQGYVEWDQNNPAAAANRCECTACTPDASPPADFCRLCLTVSFDSARIDGNLIIKDSYLRAPQIVGRDYQTPPLRDSCALSMSHARISGSLGLLRSNSIGYVQLRSIDIRHDLWVSGGMFFSSAERPTFDLQSATIEGLLVFQAREATKAERGRNIRAFPVVVIGHVSGIGLTAGEVWLGEGIFFGHDVDPSGAWPTIYFAKSDVKRTFKLGAYHQHHVTHPDRPTGPAHVHGEICLVATNVGKNLELHGVSPHNIANILELSHPFFRSLGVRWQDSPDLRLVAEGLKVDRRVQISHAAFRDCRHVPCPDRVLEAAPTDARTPRRTRGAVDLFKSTIGTGIRFTETCRSEGAIRFNSCVIGREVIVACDRILPAPEAAASEHSLGTLIPWLLDIRESTITGHVKIGRRDVKRLGHEAVCIGGGATLENAKVQGSLVLRNVTFDISGYTGISIAQAGRPAEDDERDRIALNLRDCECGSDFEVFALRWKMPPLTNAEEFRLNQRRGMLEQLTGWTHPRRFFDVTEAAYAAIDLRGFRCSLLSDGFGKQWALSYRMRLRLAGIRIGELEAGNGQEARSRLRWLAHQSRIQQIEAVDGADALSPKRITFPERLRCTREDDFVPQAYDVFAAANRRAGEDRTALELLVEKQDVENTLRYDRMRRKMWNLKWFLGFVIFAAASIFSAVVLDLSRDTQIILISFLVTILFWPWVSAIFQILFGFGFRYGLSPDRALLVLLGFILVGWYGVNVARTGRWVHGDPGNPGNPTFLHASLDPAVALVMNVPAAPSLRHQLPLPHRSSNVRDRADTRRQAEVVYAEPSPCNLNVSSLLYAVDTFIPALDLGQEEQCAIRDAEPDDPDDRYFWWRLGKAIYEIIGWVVTSIVILTVTGWLRRNSERR